MNNLRPFKAWCQKVLPLVYDESLSYYEQLCKVVDYLNKTMENVNELGSAFNDLKNFVDNYFDNLDVQEEINNKLDEMVKDGSLTEIVSKYFSNRKVPVSADAEVTQMIYNCVRSYMENYDKMCYAHLYDDGGDFNACNYKDGAKIWTNPRTGFTGYPMNCSCFAMLVMWGVDYYHSMMTPEYQLNNIFGSAGYCFNPYGDYMSPANYEDIRTTKLFAKWFNEHGILQDVDADFRNVQPGDIVLFRDLEEFPEPSLDSIHHCGVVLAKIDNGSTSRFIYADYRESENRKNECNFHDFNINVVSNINLMPTYVGRPIYTKTKTVKPKLLGDYTNATPTGTYTLGTSYEKKLITAVIEYTAKLNTAPLVVINGTHYAQYDLPKGSSTSAGKVMRGVTTFQTYQGDIKLNFNNCDKVSLYEGVMCGELGDSLYCKSLSDLVNGAKKLVDNVANNATAKTFDAYIDTAEINANTYKCFASLSTSKAIGYIIAENGNSTYVILVNGDNTSVFFNRTNYSLNSLSSIPKPHKTLLLDGSLDGISASVIIGYNFMLFMTNADVIHVDRVNNKIKHLVKTELN